MEREKMIEEIIKTIINIHLECVLNRKEPKYSRCAICKYKDGNWCFLEKKIAEAVYDLIIPDGAVVLTKEEYEQIKKDLSDFDVIARQASDIKSMGATREFIEQSKKELEQTRKETAREIFEKLSMIATPYHGINVVYDAVAIREIKEIIKKYGVEVGKNDGKF